MLGYNLAVFFLDGFAAQIHRLMWQEEGWAVRLVATICSTQIAAPEPQALEGPYLDIGPST